MSGGSRLSDRLLKLVIDFMIRRRWYLPGSPFRRAIVRLYARRDSRDRIWYFNTPTNISQTQVDAFQDWWEGKA